MENSISWSLKRLIGTDAFPVNFKHGYRLVIKGRPGAGKTTCGLHILHHHLNENPEEFGISHGLIVYFQEDPQEFDKIAKNFNLNFHTHPPDTLCIEEAEFTSDFPLLRNWISNREREHIKKSPCCILIDGLTILRALEPNQIHRYLITLLSDVVKENILLVVLAEESLSELTNFFDYMADAVINLSKATGTQRHRFLEIEKMRYLDHARGAHGFEFYKRSRSKGSVFRIYPRGSFESILDKSNESSITNNNHYCESGIQGLDQILSSNASSNALSKSLHPGDVFVITVEPGTEKIGFGLSFLLPIFTDLSDGKALWLSFGEGDILHSLNCEPYNNRFPLIADHIFHDRNDTFRSFKDSKFIHSSRANPSVHPDRLTCKLINALSLNPNITKRVVIDGLSSLESEFEDIKQADRYLARISRIVHNNNAIAVIFIDLPSSFTSIGNLLMPWSNSADFIGHLRWYEINNELAMAFSVSKSKFPVFSSFPYYVQHNEKSIQPGRMQLEDRGWPMVSMLSGRMDQIHESNVFLKFFDQNYPGRCVNAPILENFKKRYSSNQNFTHVFRAAPSPKHWSFRAYKGAGHSNTKVVCLKQYIMNVLQEDERLIAFPKDEMQKYPLHMKDVIPDDDYIHTGSYSLWGLVKQNRNGKNNKNGNVDLNQQYGLPLYADIGVLCCQINHERLSNKANKEVQGCRLNFEKSLPDAPPETWDELFSYNNKFQEAKMIQISESENKDPCYYCPPWIENLFSIPSLTLDAHCFFIFFLEVLFGYNEQYSECNSSYIKDDLSLKNGLINIINSKAFDNTINLLRRMVIENVSKTPLEKMHYHNAYFSRRWFTHIEQYPINDPKLPDVEKYLLDRTDPRFSEDSANLKERFFFSIHRIPSEKKGHGISCLDFYSLGVIRGALAPETAFMFISELASSTADLERFEHRRGLPTLRNNWSCHPKLTTRIEDRNVIDSILNLGKYFCNTWIPNYWHIESNVSEWGRKIFVRTKAPLINYSSCDIVQYFSVSIDSLRRELISICKSK